MQAFENRGVNCRYFSKGDANPKKNPILWPKLGV